MISPPNEDQVERTSPKSIRKIFNKSQYPRWIENGILVPKYIRNKHLPKPQLVHEPWCTYSQFIRYCDVGGHWVVEVHQYFRSEDNSIGGQGKPDPKRLRIGNKIFIADKQVST